MPPNDTIDPTLFASTTDPALTSSHQDDSIRFTPSEEADLLQQSHSQKLFANTLFSSSHYTDAISKYEQALSLCPNYLDYEIAILKSNIAACFIKLEDWKSAVDSATEALDRLERILLLPSSSSSFKGKDKEKAEEEGHDDDDDGKVVEITMEGRGEQEEEDALAALQKKDKQKADGQRIRAKALLRRARAKSELGGWANLQAAHEDYILLTKIPSLPILEQETIKRALSSLPARITQAKEKEMGEMLGKLKDLGNGLLKPFGLSTDMFKMQQDPETGGYSMQVNQGG